MKQHENHIEYLLSRGWKIKAVRHSMNGPSYYWTHKDHVAPTKRRLCPGAFTTAQAMELDRSKVAQ